MSIRYKLTAGLLPFLVGALIYGGIQVKSNYSLSQDFANINSGVQLSVKISYLVHELQKERGRTSGFLSSEGREFKQELRDQRRLTTERYQEFKKHVETTDLSRFSDKFQSEVNSLSEALTTFFSVRDSVDDFTVTQVEAIRTYTAVNTLGLNIIGHLSDETQNSQLKQQLMSYVSFLRAKENAGIERAVMSGIFIRGIDDYNYNWESDLVQNQNNFTNLFNVTASEKNRAKYNEVVTGVSVEEVDRMRDLVSSRKLQLGEVDPNYWFDQITIKINLLKKVEDFLSADIQEGALASVKQFWIYLAIAAFFALASMALIFISIRSLLANISKLSDYTQTVSRGNLDQSIELDTNDEIGNFAEVFSTMVSDVREARNEIFKEKIEIEYLQKQAKVVFDNVKQGIFLIGKDNAISDLYSTEMEVVFNTKEIAGMDFVQFMRPLLVARDLESVEMFIRHLFNKEVDVATLEQLNPLAQVKLFIPDQTGMMQTKYVKMDFTRIQDTHDIYNIMVTAVDETAQVKLQKEIEESEERSKEEMEQLLSILKIEPVALNEYLNKTLETLEDISMKYERGSKEDFSTLLTYTYNAVHNLKGNATLIDLQLMVKKLHDVEDVIVDLRQRSNVTNENFLEILFKINAINLIVKNMMELTQKVQNVSNKMEFETAEDGSNDAFVIALERGVNRLSNEIGKKVNFNIDISDRIKLPENLKAPMKDIITQLVRNSLVHGIETPEERLASGKPESSNIDIKVVKTNDDDFKMSYKDDGRGIDVDKILQKAKDRNLRLSSANGNIDSRDLAKLIFADGFSTADKVSDNAGRGQGMSVIKSIVRTYNGKMSLSHGKGKYFAMNFLLPKVETNTISKKVA